MKRVARTIREQLRGLVNAVVLRVTNAAAESQNSKIEWIKKQACGFRNRQRFKNAICFHLGEFDLLPRPPPQLPTQLAEAPNKDVSPPAEQR